MAFPIPGPMNQMMLDLNLNDLSLLAVLVSFCAVLTVAALWGAAVLRLDKVAGWLNRQVSAKLRAVVACVMGGASAALLLGYIPGTLLLDSWAATAAVVWMIASLVVLSASGRERQAAAQAAIPESGAETAAVSKAA